jgi:hypothetical protein
MDSRFKVQCGTQKLGLGLVVHLGINYPWYLAEDRSLFFFHPLLPLRFDPLVLKEGRVLYVGNVASIQLEGSNSRCQGVFYYMFQ